MNRLTIIGNLTRDPELRTTQGGDSVCSFTVAVGRPGKKDEADFFNVSAWRKLGENCAKYLAKGRKVAVVGSVGVHTYTTRDGRGGASLEVTATEIEFLSPKDAAGTVAANDNPTPGQYTEVDPGDDLPF